MASIKMVKKLGSIGVRSALDSGDQGDALN
jgi:hypothetical protein